MVVMNAIRSLSNRNAILVLITSYVESLQHGSRAGDAPDFLVRLPISGEADLCDRLQALNAAPGAVYKGVATVREASAVFESALHRLAHIKPAD